LEKAEGEDGKQRWEAPIGGHRLEEKDGELIFSQATQDMNHDPIFKVWKMNR
jgi:hypothetical protein